MIYCEDHGTTWKLGGRTPQPQVDECQIVELASGQLMLNMRIYDRSIKNRQTVLSDVCVAEPP